MPGSFWLTSLRATSRSKSAGRLELSGPRVFGRTQLNVVDIEMTTYRIRDLLGVFAVGGNYGVVPAKRSLSNCKIDGIG